MKKEIFISTLKRIKIIFHSIKLTKDYYKFSKQENYHGLLEFFHSLSDPYVYTWEQNHIGKGRFFAMNISLSTTPVEDRSILVIFNEDDTVTIQTDLNCSLQIESTTTGLDEAFERLIGLVYMYMHPELKNDEVYFGNIVKDVPFITKGTYKTLRTGEKVFNSNGNEIKNISPMFISKNEHELLTKELFEDDEYIMSILKEIFKNI